jgi:hypothetical protein
VISSSEIVSSIDLETPTVRNASKRGASPADAAAADPAAPPPGAVLGALPREYRVLEAALERSGSGCERFGGPQLASFDLERRLELFGEHQWGRGVGRRCERVHAISGRIRAPSQAPGHGAAQAAG